MCVGMNEIIEKREKNMEEKGGAKGIREGRKNGEKKMKKENEKKMGKEKVVCGWRKGVMCI